MPKKSPSTDYWPILIPAIGLIVVALITGYSNTRTALVPIEAAQTQKAADQMTAVVSQSLTPHISTSSPTATATFTLTPLPLVVPTNSVTPGVGDFLVGLIDNYYQCINKAQRNSDSEYKSCWDLLSKEPGEFQDNLNKLNSGYGLASFIDFWNDFKVTYALFYCQKDGINLVDAEYNLYKWNDLSAPIGHGKKNYMEYSFGLDSNGWRIKGGNASITRLGAFCEPTSRIERWTPTPSP